MPPTRWPSRSATPITGRARRPAGRDGVRSQGDMIGKLRGTLDEIGEDYCTVDVGGVFYVAYCSMRTLASLPGPGEAVDAVHRDLCARGHDPALRLQDLARARLVQAAAEQRARASAPRSRWPSCRRSRRPTSPMPSRLRDIATVSRAPGVGKKVAERIVTELKNKAPAFAGSAVGHDRPEAGTRRGRCARADLRRGLGAGQSRLFARHRRQRHRRCH